MSFQDEVLVHLIRIVEETGVGIGITLFVNGLTISGNMMSSKKYFDEISNHFNEDNFAPDDPNFEGNTIPYLQQFRQFMHQSGISREEQDNPKYIHLEKVTIIYSSDSSHDYGATVWRGKLSSIDGFVIGQGSLDAINEEEEEDEEVT
jgi:hypothetical protein